MKFEERFEIVVTNVREYHKNIIRKLEAVFDDMILDSLYTFPQSMLEMMQKDSGVEWDDAIWFAVYNDTACSDILKMIQNKKQNEWYHTRKEAIETFREDITIALKFKHKCTDSQISKFMRTYTNKTAIEDMKKYSAEVVADIVYEYVILRGEHE